MRNFIEACITIILVIITVIVMINLVTRAVDRKEIEQCKDHIVKAEAYTGYFITQADKDACDNYHVDVAGIKIIDAK